MALIAACVGVDLVTRVEGSIGSYLMFVPKLAEQEPYRFLASAFVHASFWHLLLNMYVLWVFGSVLEPAIGHARYLGIYLLSAVAGNAAVILTADPLGNSWFTTTVGASGAVFGLLGAQLVVARVSGADLTGFLVFIALNAVISLSPDSGISWQSHAGGFVAGVVAMYAFSRARVLSPEKRRIVDAVAFAALGEALAVVVAVWGYS
jgi:rhomboid family protein